MNAEVNIYPQEGQYWFLFFSCQVLGEETVSSVCYRDWGKRHNLSWPLFSVISIMFNIFSGFLLCNIDYMWCNAASNSVAWLIRSYKNHLAPVNRYIKKYSWKVLIIKQTSLFLLHDFFSDFDVSCCKAHGKYYHYCCAMVWVIFCPLFKGIVSRNE